jgi:hypothetical protein
VPRFTAIRYEEDALFYSDAASPSTGPRAPPVQQELRVLGEPKDRLEVERFPVKLRAPLGHYNRSEDGE